MFSPRIRSPNFNMPRMNRSLDINVVCEGSPSRILRVLLISLGITILPKSSTLLTMPVAFIVYLSPFTILYGTTVPRCHCEERSDVAISSEQLILEIATPVCALVRNDSGSRQPPTIILQITLLVFVKNEEIYEHNLSEG